MSLARPLSHRTRACNINSHRSIYPNVSHSFDLCSNISICIKIRSGGKDAPPTSPSWAESWHDEELDDNAGAGALAQGPLIEAAEPTVSPYLILGFREKAFGLKAPSWRPEGTVRFKALLPPSDGHCVLFVELVP